MTAIVETQSTNETQSDKVRNAINTVKLGRCLSIPARLDTKCRETAKKGLTKCAQFAPHPVVTGKKAHHRRFDDLDTKKEVRHKRTMAFPKTQTQTKTRKAPRGHAPTIPSAIYSSLWIVYRERETEVEGYGYSQFWGRLGTHYTTFPMSIRDRFRFEEEYDR